jgi:hypothetical protein
VTEELKVTLEAASGVGASADGGERAGIDGAGPFL